MKTKDSSLISLLLSILVSVALTSCGSKSSPAVSAEASSSNTENQADQQNQTSLSQSKVLSASTKAQKAPEIKASIHQLPGSLLTFESFLPDLLPVSKPLAEGLSSLIDSDETCHFFDMAQYWD